MSSGILVTYFGSNLLKYQVRKGRPRETLSRRYRSSSSGSREIKLSKSLSLSLRKCWNVISEGVNSASCWVDVETGTNGDEYKDCLDIWVEKYVVSLWVSVEGVDGAVVVVCPEQRRPVDSISLEMKVSSLCPSSPVRSIMCSSSSFLERTVSHFSFESIVAATSERSLIFMSGWILVMAS